MATWSRRQTTSRACQTIDRGWARPHPGRSPEPDARCSSKAKLWDAGSWRLALTRLTRDDKRHRCRRGGLRVGSSSRLTASASQPPHRLGLIGAIGRTRRSRRKGLADLARGGSRAVQRGRGGRLLSARSHRPASRWRLSSAAAALAPAATWSVSGSRAPAFITHEHLLDAADFPAPRG